MGSFRRIELRRGGRLVQTIDLYDYLLRGETSGDVRLENNDQIFIPPVDKQVEVEGAVRRPAIYEALPGETLRDIILFAGGFTAEAVVRRIQIDRIQPPELRSPGMDRVLVEADIATLTTPLHDGDIIHVAAVAEERRNRIVLEGDVNSPGIFQYTPGMTLRDLISRAEGFDENAYRARVHVYRLSPEDGRRQLIAVPMLDDADGTLRLSDRDSVVVFSRASMRNVSLVTISGFVKTPDTYELAEGMTLRDLVLTAGGFTHGAYVLEAEISRQPNPLTRTDTTAILYTIPLGLPSLSSTDSIGHLADTPMWVPSGSEIPLRHGDRVFIRQAPGFREPRTVVLRGEVVFPGEYDLRTRGEQLAQVIARAGGVTTDAYTPGLSVVRGGRVIAGDMGRALLNPADRNNIVLEAGDTIHVPRYNPIVTVTGLVTFNANVNYVPGKSLDYYIGQAGGYQENADEDRVTVLYQNGQRAAVRKFGLFSRKPEIEPGTTIFVPAEPQERSGVNWDQVLTRTLTIVSTTATLLLAISQLDKN